MEESELLQLCFEFASTFIIESTAISKSCNVQLLLVLPQGLL